MQKTEIVEQGSVPEANHSIAGASWYITFTWFNILIVINQVC